MSQNPPEDPIEEVIKRISSIEPEKAYVLNCHLLIERYINDLLRLNLKFLEEPGELGLLSRKMVLLQAMGQPPPGHSVWKELKLLNRARNAFVHDSPEEEEKGALAEIGKMFAGGSKAKQLIRWTASFCWQPFKNTLSGHANLLLRVSLGYSCNASLF
jgi:hypothetical protein